MTEIVQDLAKQVEELNKKISSGPQFRVAPQKGACYKCGARGHFKRDSDKNVARILMGKTRGPSPDPIANRSTKENPRLRSTKHSRPV